MTPFRLISGLFVATTGVCGIMFNHFGDAAFYASIFIVFIGGFNVGMSAVEFGDRRGSDWS